jgi:phage shock protein B
LQGLFLLGVFLLLAIKIFRGSGGSKKERRATADEEARLIQEIYQGLTRMERRVESLETILFDRKERGNDAI